MIFFKPSRSWDEDVPLTWRNYTDGKTILDCSPVIVDPNWHYLSIHKHRVLGDGTVQPSVVCPVEGCGFHEWIKLEGWACQK